MKLLCIFRKYPPFIGGLETFGYNLIKNIKEQNRDTKGDIYEFLLSELQTAGKNGQFRTQ